MSIHLLLLLMDRKDRSWEARSDEYIRICVDWCSLSHLVVRNFRACSVFLLAQDRRDVDLHGWSLHKGSGCRWGLLVLGFLRG